MRRRPTLAAGRFRDAAARAELVTTDAVVMEVLAGARDERHHREISQALALHPRVPTEPHDFEDAASIYRACRRRGLTPRNLVDCLIAAVARRVDAAVLHSDRDFDAIAEVVELRIDA